MSGFACWILLAALPLLWPDAAQCGAQSEALARPSRPKVFSTPQELSSYLDAISNYYAVAGRPSRFGKRSSLISRHVPGGSPPSGASNSVDSESSAEDDVENDISPVAPISDRAALANLLRLLRGE